MPPTRKPAAEKQKVEAKTNKAVAKKGNAPTGPNLGNLSQLVGRIANRTSKSAVKVAAAGSKNLDAGVAVASIGSSFGATGKLDSALKKHNFKGVSTKGRGAGKDGFAGLGGIGTGGAGVGGIGILEEETVIIGGLDKDVIARYIKSKLGQILYCYERQLSANPDIYGKVHVKFEIGARGNVNTQKVEQTTLNNSNVENCILKRVAKWNFPKPKGGTRVVVTYPFLFKSTN